MEGMINACLLEAQEVGCLVVVPGNHVGLTKLLSEGGTLPQSPVLNGGSEEGRRVDLFPQVETRVRDVSERSVNRGLRHTSNGSSCFERSRGLA